MFGSIFTILNPHKNKTKKWGKSNKTLQKFHQTIVWNRLGFMLWRLFDSSLLPARIEGVPSTREQNAISISFLSFLLIFVSYQPYKYCVSKAFSNANVVRQGCAVCDIWTAPRNWMKQFQFRKMKGSALLDVIRVRCRGDDLKGLRLDALEAATTREENRWHRSNLRQAYRFLLGAFAPHPAARYLWQASFQNRKKIFPHITNFQISAALGESVDDGWLTA
jgi:hypothetical protein